MHKEAQISKQTFHNDAKVKKLLACKLLRVKGAHRDINLL